MLKIQTTNSQNSKARLLTVRIVIASLLAGCTVGMGPVATVARAQQVPEYPHPAVKPRQPQTRKPTLSELYAMFLNYAVHVETAADADAKLGKDSSFFRMHLQKASGLSAQEYAKVLVAAREYASVDAETEKQLIAATKEFKTREMSGQHLSGVQAIPIHLKVKDLLTRRTTALTTEIAAIREALGSERAGVLNVFLQSKYNLGRIGSPLHPSRPSQGDSLQASPALVVIDEEGVVCDDDDYVCADAQMAYRGAGGEVDFYSYVTLGDSFIDDADAGAVFLEASEADGYLSTNGGAQAPYCGTGASVACPGPGYGALAGGNSYIWYAYGAIGFYYACDDGDGPYPCGDEESDDQETPDSVDLPKPTDISVSPDAVNPGAAGTFTVDGDGIISPFENPPSATVSNEAGVFDEFSPTPDYENGTISIAYNVQTDADTGSETVTVNNGFASGTADITVNEPAPVITSVTVVGATGNTLEAGTATQSITLTGENFGSAAPTITVSSSGTTAGDLDSITILAGSVTAPTPSVAKAKSKQKSAVARSTLAKPGTNPKPQDEANQTQTITFKVSVAADAPDGDVSFALRTSDGASDPNATSPAVPVAANTPAPKIMIVNSPADLANCANGTVAPNGAGETDVYAGQQVLLCVAPPPNGLAIQGQSWTFENNADIVGGYTNAQGGQPSAATGGPLAANLTQSGLTVYFINIGGTETATYRWVLNNGDAGGASSTADFKIVGPTGPLLPNAFLEGNDTATTLGTPTVNPASVKMSNAPLSQAVFGALSGVWFNDTATVPPQNNGKFIFVQLLNSVVYSQVAPVGYEGPANADNQLDGNYPYPNINGFATNDSPGETLLAGIGEAGISFDATMYAMWDPALPAGCAPASTNTKTYVSTPSNCTSIPVPLGSVEWTWSPCVINEKAPLAGGGLPTPSWVVKCGPGGLYQPLANGYPVWNSCHKSDNGSC
jgi:hypothetical protein